MEDFRTVDLPNHMQVHYIRMPNTHSVVISFFVRAGLRYECPKHMGVSHLIEHLLFRRLDDLEQRQLYYEMECLGTTLRATTYPDFIRFYAEVLPQFAEKVFQIMEKLFRGGNWTMEDIRKEKKVVENQILERLPSYRDRSDLEYWAHTPLGNRVMGTVSGINRLTKSTITEYYNRFFQPHNCSFVASGNFSKEFIQYSQNRLSMLHNKNFERLSIGPIYPNHFYRRTQRDDIIFDTDGNYADVRICFEADHRYIKPEAAEYLHSILGDGDGSRLSIPLREETGLVDEIYTEFERHSGFSVLSIQYDVVCDRLIESLELVFSVISGLLSEITNKDMNASVHFLTSNWAFKLDSPSELNFLYGWRFFILGERFETSKEMTQKYGQIIPEELRKAAISLFRSKQMTSFIYCNQTIVRSADIFQKLKLSRACIAQENE